MVKVFFLGYSNNSRALCVYNKITQSIIESAKAVIDDYQDFIDYLTDEEITSLLETPNLLHLLPQIKPLREVNLVNVL